MKSDDWYVAPSPATKQFSIHLSSETTARVVVDLIEPNGRVVQTKVVSVEKGSNVIIYKPGSVGERPVFPAPE